MVGTEWGNVVSVNRLKWHFQSLRYALWWGVKIIRPY